MFYKLRLDSKPISLIKHHVVSNRAKLLLINAMFFLNKNNMLVGSPSDLQEKLNLGKNEFELGIKELKIFDLVRKYSKQEYMFNPELLYCGDEKKYAILLHMWEKQTTRGVRKQ